MNIHDTSAIGNAQQLAMVEIEKMEDYDTVRTLIGNAGDILDRATAREAELLLKMRTKPRVYLEGFTVSRVGQDYTAYWLLSQSNRQRTRCYTCNELVEGNKPRLRVSNGPKSKETRRSKGAKNEYNCVRCALQFYSTSPPD